MILSNLFIHFWVVVVSGGDGGGSGDKWMVEWGGGWSGKIWGSKGGEISLYTPCTLLI